MKKPEDSYRAHDEELIGHLRDDGLRRLAETWMQVDTVDRWRQERMLSSLDPILSCHPESCWLTVGDGRWGRDARYILDHGSRALATDISGSLLKEAQKRGYIPECDVQNAEHMSFRDNSFDFVLCKESYHHFPRPAIALYEMLRVVRRAVVLIEPQDEYPGRPLRALKILIKRMTGRPFQTGYDCFESVGNYVYTISKRELTKVALGLDLRHIAFRSLNSFYMPGIEYERVTTYNRSYLTVRLMILIQDVLTALGAVRSGLLVGIVFKEAPEERLAMGLKAKGFKLVELPRNPFTLSPV
jgi:SAM-dependent methyltransferase